MHMHTHRHMHMRMHTHAHACTHVCIQVHVDTLHAHIHTPTCACTHAHAYQKHAPQAPQTTIPPKIIKDNCDIFALKLHHDLNDSIDNLKTGRVKIVMIKPIIDQQVFYQQYLKYLNTFFYQVHQALCGTMKGYSSQHCLFVMFEKLTVSPNKRACSDL